MKWKGIVIVISLIIGIGLLLNGFLGLQEVNKEIDEARPVFISGFEEQLEYCLTPHPDAVDPDALWRVCQEGVERYQNQCDFYGNPDVCNDSRIEQILFGNIPK